MSLLADCEANRSIMWNELGLVLSLNKILDKVRRGGELQCFGA